MRSLNSKPDKLSVRRMTRLLKQAVLLAIWFCIAAIAIISQPSESQAREMTCSQSTLNAFAEANDGHPDTLGVLVMSENNSFLWGLGNDECGAFSYGKEIVENTGSNTCIWYVNGQLNSESTMALCADYDESHGNKRIGVSRGGADITNVTVYGGIGSTSGVNLSRDTWRRLGTSEYFRVTYTDKHEGRRWFEFTTNSDGTGVTDSSITVRADNDPPRITPSDLPGQVSSGGSFTATFIADEDVVGVELADIQAGLINATASNFTTVIENRKFTALITPTGTDDISISFPDGVATDKADNPNVGGGPVTITVSDEPVIVTISGVPATGTAGVGFTATFIFTDSNGFVEAKPQFPEHSDRCSVYPNHQR